LIAHDAHSAWNTWLRLRDYKGGGLVEERRHHYSPRCRRDCWRSAPGTACTSPMRAASCTSATGRATTLLIAVNCVRHHRESRSTSAREALKLTTSGGLSVTWLLLRPNAGHSTCLKFQS
jgi:hypothetical protein